MINIIIKKVGSLYFYPRGCAFHDLRNLQPTSSEPNEWRDEDVEHIIDVLGKGIGKQPIITVDYMGRYDHNLLEFIITYESKVPNTTLKKNKETIKYCILMECV